MVCAHYLTPLTTDAPRVCRERLPGLYPSLGIAVVTNPVVADTCASLAIKSGANIKVVQKLLGHKSAVLTLDRYGHLFPDDLDALATAFDAAARFTADALRTASLTNATGPLEKGA